jgi:hypothetical protein
VGAETHSVRYERLVLEGHGTTFTLDLHPKLTVLAGISPVERTALVSELLGALHSTRTGVHLEAVEDTGRHLAVFRPSEGRARVIDVDQVTDVTGEFLDEQGHVDLLRPTGLDLASARNKLVLRGSDLQTESHADAVVDQLSRLDQGPLWIAAERSMRAARELDEASLEMGTSADDASTIEQVEERHQRFEAAVEYHDRVRRLNLAITAVAVIGTALSLLRTNGEGASAFIVTACVSMLYAVYTRNQAVNAEEAEAEALDAAGATSYLGFHVQRVEKMMTGEQARKRVMTAAAEHRRAEESWRRMVGEVSAAWALDHYEEVSEAAAARAAIDLRAQADLAIDLRQLDRGAGDPARALVERIAQLKSLGGAQEGYPLLLDDPFAELPRAAKPALLELLSHAADSTQLVYLTDDEAVASWARVEALTGALSIIEPSKQTTAEAVPS